MATNPLFTVTFDVNSNQNYGDFIDDLRRKLAIPNHSSHGRPVLRPVVPIVPWFHVVLRTQTRALTLATRADNLYLEGFRSSDGTWWELTPGLIDPGAKYVGFGHRYRDLVGDADYLVNVALGPGEMTEAVNVLAARTRADLASGPQQQRAKDALVVLLLMVHEATRIQTVSKKVSELMHQRKAMKSGKITSQMKEQVKGWEDLSKALLKTGVLLNLGHGRSAPGRFTPFENMDVKTAEKAAETVGILLFEEVPGGMTTATALQLLHAN